MNHRPNIFYLHQDEDGGAYTLSYVMIIPLVIFLCCLVVETCLMLMASMGTVYASYAGARTAVVQYRSTTDAQARQQIEFAAVQAMVPFASGIAETGAPADSSAAARDYVDAFRRQFPDARASDDYLLSKFQFAAESMIVETSGAPADWQDDISVTVTYKYPYAFGITGKLFGAEREGNRYVRSMTSTSELQSESPRNEEQQLGISYASP